MVTSPCTGFCRIEAEGFCRGCGRTREEIGAWRGADEDFRRRVWAELPRRRAALGITLHRKDWSADDLCAFVADALRDGGVLSVGHGVAFQGEASVQGNAVRCVTARGALALALDKPVCAFATDADDNIVILATPRKAGAPLAGLRRLGPDRHAVREEDRDAILYDLGLGHAARAFCLRVADPDAIARLDALAGRGALAGRDAGAVFADQPKVWAPDSVVLTPIGRIEIFSKTPILATQTLFMSEISPTYAACAFLQRPARG